MLELQHIAATDGDLQIDQKTCRKNLARKPVEVKAGIVFRRVVYRRRPGL